MIKLLKRKILNLSVRYGDGIPPMWLIKESFYNATKFSERSRTVLEDILVARSTGANTAECIRYAATVHNCTRERIRQIVAKHIRTYLGV